jgi:hypothetical protein
VLPLRVRHQFPLRARALAVREAAQVVVMAAAQERSVSVVGD